MTKTGDVYGIVFNHSGISCNDICNLMNDKQSIISGILTSMKYRERVHNINGLWYTCRTLDVQTIINTLIDVHCENDINTEWSEGYISAMADMGNINENEFEILLKRIKQ